MSRILVTNDDGFESRGLHALVSRLCDNGHDVSVIAPLTDMTGCGTSVGEARPGTRIRIEHREHAAMPDVALFVLDRGPSMCVLAGCFGAIGAPPDLVCAGINAGPNVGNIINHSGTLGAVFTAQHLGLRGLAVSLDLGAAWDWSLAQQIAGDAVHWVQTAPAGTAVNVNVPNRPASEVGGVRYAPVVGAIGDLGFTVTEDREALEMTYAPVLAEGSDSALLHAGYITVTTLNGPAPADEGGAALAAHLEATLG